MFDDFCCAVEWDCECQNIAIDLCDTVAPNDTCGPTAEDTHAGATLVTIPSDFKDAFHLATALDTADPAMCCHNGLPLMCQSGDLELLTCTADDQCQNAQNPDAMCGPRINKPFASLWYKFVATNTSAQIQTCTSSSSGATDSVIQVFEATNPNATTDAQACPSLVPVACSDDVPGCGPGGKLSRVCAEGLISGQTYYFLVGGKSFETRGEYRITIASTPCSVSGDADNDWCHRGLPITDGSPQDPQLVPFATSNSILDCPGPNCASAMDKDIWFDYTATCTGNARIDTCEGDPGTTLVVYEGCECPAPLESPLACNDDNAALCGGSPSASGVMLEVQAGSCYKVRLGNENGSSPAGTLAIACGVQACPFESVCFENPDFCNDNNVCTQDVCDEGAEGCCIYNDPPCPAPGSCELSTGCDPTEGCQYASVCSVNPNQCNDGNLCTSDVCDETASGCCLHTPVNCDDNNQCTDDSCEPLLGCRYQPAEPLPLNCVTIPTVSEWGLVVLALLVLVVGKVSFGRRGETAN